jgi:hypothetical protein
MYQNMYSEDRQQLCAYYFQQELSYSNSTSDQSSVQLYELSQSIQNLSDQFKLMLDYQKQQSSKQQEFLRTMKEEFASHRRFLFNELGNSSKSAYQENKMKRWGHSSSTNKTLSNIQKSLSTNSSEKLPKPNINQIQMTQVNITSTSSRIFSPSIAEEVSLFQTKQVIIPVQKQQQVIERPLGHSLFYTTTKPNVSNSINGEVKNAHLPALSNESTEKLLHQKVQQFQEPFETSISEKFQSIEDEFMIVLIPSKFQKEVQKWYQRYSTFEPFTNFHGFKTRRRKEFIQVFRNASHFKLDLNKAINQECQYDYLH